MKRFSNINSHKNAYSIKEISFHFQWLLILAHFYSKIIKKKFKTLKYSSTFKNKL